MNNDLISRKALLERIKEDAPWWWQNFHSYLVVDMLKEAPVIDAEPVRHGWWTAYKIDGRYGLNETSENRCSICNRYSIFAYRFCPECGAKMDGGTDGDNKQ